MQTQCVTRKVVALRWHKRHKSSSAPQYKYPGLKRWNRGQKKIPKYHYRRPKPNVRLPSYDATQDQIKMKQTGLPSKTTKRRRALSLATVKQNVPILVHRRTRNVTNHRGYKNNTAERTDENRNPTLAPGHASHKNTTQSKWPTRQTYACKRCVGARKEKA